MSRPTPTSLAALSSLALAAGCAIGPIAPVWADEAELAPVTVTASRAPVRLDHATGQIEVVTRDEIEARNPGRLTDILNLLPGVFTSPGKGMLQPSPGFALRGMPDDRRTLVLVDGLPLNDGYSGSSSLGGLSPDLVDQAEVLYGPMSSLYGGNAMGGVINFVTRMPTKTEFKLRAGYGNPFEAGKAPEGVRKVFGSAGTRLDNGLSLLITANWAATDGYKSDWVTSTANANGARYMTGKDGKPGYLYGKKGDNTWDEDGAAIKLEQRLSDGSRWRLGWQRQRYDYGYDRSPETYLRKPGGLPDYGSTPSLFAGGNGGFERNLFHAGFDTDLGIGRLNVLASYNNVVSNYYVTPTGNVSGGAGRISDSPAQSASLDAYWTAPLGRHVLTTGVALRRDDADNKDYSLSNWTNPGSKTSLYAQASGRTTLIAAYAQDEWSITDRLTAQLGARYDYWKNEDGSIRTPGWPAASQINADYASRSASALSPKAGLAFKASDSLSLRASAGSAFRAPSIYDLYRTTRVTYNIMANPELKPEKVRTWEVGADWKPWQGGEAKLTYFENDLRDLVYVRGSSGTRYRDNLERAESRGVTVSLAQRFSVAGFDSRAFASVTYTDSAVKENSHAPASVGKQLTFLPKKQATVGLETRRGAWTLATSGRYASKQYATDDNSDVATNVYGVYDAYFVVDAKVAYRIDRNVSVSLAIDNLTNRDYFSLYPATGRSWFAAVALDY